MNGGSVGSNGRLRLIGSEWQLATTLRKFNINHKQLAYVFCIVWLRLAAWDY